MLANGYEWSIASNEHIYLTTGVKMKSLLAKIIKWKRENSVKYNTHNRNSEFSSQLFDAGLL
jgi:hypothetical protein